MRKSSLLSALFALFLFAAAPQARAQADISIGPRVGYEVNDIEELFIGADARIGLPTLPVRINPTFDYFFVGEGGSVFQITGNALYDFGTANVAFTPYAGAGISATHVSADNSDFSTTEVGLNLLGGAEFTEVSGFVPFAQAQFALGGDVQPFSIMAGILFNVGS